MSASERRLWLIAYDIAHPKRLRRVHGYLREHALAIQYSVFFGELSERDVGQVLAGVREHLDARRDDVRAYPLPQHCQALVIGPTAFLGGAYLSGRLSLMARVEPEEEESGRGGWVRKL